MRADVRSLGKCPSLEEKKRLQEKREVLQAKVEDFQQQGMRFLSLDSIEMLGLAGASAIPSDSSESDEEEFFLEKESDWMEEEEVEVPIEHARLGLPSSFGPMEQTQMGLGRVVQVEIELREGQANDALEALRAGLAEKALRFRIEVKPAKSQKTATRAWDSVHRADKQIKAAVQSYKLARSALIRLEASASLLSQYQEIKKEDLKMSKDIVEENRVGQRSSELAWFWRLDRKWDNNQGEFLKECKLPS